MSRNLHPYPAYKDSGVPWLGQVPEHWHVKRLKHVFSKIIGGSTPSNSEPAYWNGDVVWVTPADISKHKRLSDSIRHLSHEGLNACSAELVPAGSIIVTTRAPVGNVAIAEVELCTNQGCKALVTSGELIEPEYALALVGSMVDELKSLAVGTTFTEISTSRLAAVSAPVPPLQEQHAITRFLDHIDRRINRYIRAKRKLIALLNEQKQAIIHRAVTRGLDPNVPLKPSGVEWLGEIPAHWAALPLKKCVSTKITDGPHETPTLLDEGVPFLSAESIVDNHFDFSKRRGFISKEDHALFSKKCYPQRFDVFMCKSGATTGKVAMVETDEEFSVWSPLALIRADSTKVLPHFLFMVLQTAYVQRQVQLTWSYGTQPNLSMSAMERLLIVLPPLSEQEAILDCIDPIVTQLGEAVTKARKQIDLIREYRTRLIADVVTGKLDVRGVALPEEGETDAEELDEQGLDGEGEELDAWEEVEDGEDD